jgi:hypothetical protein
LVNTEAISAAGSPVALIGHKHVGDSTGVGKVGTLSGVSQEETMLIQTMNKK